MKQPTKAQLTAAVAYYETALTELANDFMTWRGNNDQTDIPTVVAAQSVANILNNVPSLEPATKVQRDDDHLEVRLAVTDV